MSRRRQVMDNRLDWRDPDMPVLREYTFGNGVRKTFVEPEYETKYRAHLMKEPGDNWKSDPTYNLRRKKNV